MAKISEVIDYLEKIAPNELQEDYDNAGLIVGHRNKMLSGILITLDVTEAVVDEAVKLNCNLIVAHHPIIFRGLKKLTGSNYVERTVEAALTQGIALYATHTNLDNVLHGVNSQLVKKIGIQKAKIINPKTDSLNKLITFVPEKDLTSVMTALGGAGAGSIGNYDLCTFQVYGKGTFRPNEEASPHIGSANQLEEVNEIRLEMIFPFHLKRNIVSTLIKAHPYEEVAFDILPLLNTDPEKGSGQWGFLNKKLPADQFLNHLKESLNLSVVKYTGKLDKEIQSVGVCGGSGSFLIKKARALQLDAFITSDIKYHEFFDAEDDLLLVDIGHYESEVFTKDLLKEIISEKFPNIALHLTSVVTNPVKFF
jgi:dinuclear metal center YbgI/SA1388 family protein